jgi:hypothetical protein
VAVSADFTTSPNGVIEIPIDQAPGSCKSLGTMYGDPTEYFQVPGQTTIVVPVVEGHVTTPVGVDCGGSATPVGR